MTLQLTKLIARLALQYSVTTKHAFIFYHFCKQRLCNYFSS